MSALAATYSTLDALRAAVEAQDHERAGQLMQAYDRSLRETVAAGEASRDDLETLADAQHRVFKRFVALRDGAADELRRARRAGSAARAYLQAD